MEERKNSAYRKEDIKQLESDFFCHSKGRRLSGTAAFCRISLVGLVLIQSFFPVAWSAMKMGNRDNTEGIGFNLVNQPEREPVDKATAGVFG